MSDEYMIVKYRMSGPPVIQRAYGTMSLDKARRICSEPSSSSIDGKTEKTVERGFKNKTHWFLGFTKA
jgi:hypothetical protein